MTSTDERLRRCFEIGFPELSADHIASASVETVAEWDSLRTVILVALVEETFAIRIPSRDYPELRSYGGLRDYLRSAEDDAD